MNRTTSGGCYRCGETCNRGEHRARVTCAGSAHRTIPGPEVLPERLAWLSAARRDGPRIIRTLLVNTDLRLPSCDAARCTHTLVDCQYLPIYAPQEAKYNKSPLPSRVEEQSVEHNFFFPPVFFRLQTIINFCYSTQI